MADKAGTLDVIVLELGRALAGLNDDFAAGNLESLIGKLGFQMPAAFYAHAGLTGAIKDVADLMPAFNVSVNTSIAANGADGGALIKAVLKLVDAINQVPAQINSAGAASGRRAARTGPRGRSSCRPPRAA